MKVVSQLINKIRSKSIKNQSVNLNDNVNVLLLKKTLNSAENSWILNNKYIYRSFEELFLSLNHDASQFLYSMDQKLIFKRATGKLSLTLFSQSFYHHIVIFPDLFNMLKSASSRRGVAVLMHELGHIYLKHNQKSLDPLEAQVAADDFAFIHGFGHELQDVLLDDNSIDSKTRVCYLTSKLIESFN